MSKMRPQAVLLPFTIWFSVALTACGGGGDSGQTPVPATTSTSAPVPQVTEGPSQATPTPTIAFDQAEPVSGALRLSVSGSFPSVAWYVDANLIGGGSTAEGNPLTWDTSKVAVGSHVVIARVTLADGSSLESRRIIEVGPTTGPVMPPAPPFVIYGGVDRYDNGGGGAWAMPQSPDGDIVKVAASLDGKPWGELSAPNGLRWFQKNEGPAYGFGFSLSDVPPCSGGHNFVITATDSAGNTQSTSFAVPTTQVPSLSVDSYVEVAGSKQTLHVSGGSCTDSTDQLHVSAALGQLPIILASGPGAFNGSLDLTGLPAGDYMLTVRAEVGLPGFLIKGSNVFTKTITITAPVQ